MHYDGTLRGRFPSPIIVDRLTGNGIEVNKEMSPLDIQKLNEMYPCKPSDPPFGQYKMMTTYGVPYTGTIRF